jgi:hypothetical protein
MRQNRLDVDSLRVVIDACDQSEAIPPDVENQAPPINIRRLKRPFHVLKAAPLRFECDLVPSVKRRPRIRMFLGEPPDGFETDYVHNLEFQYLIV